MQGTLDDFDLRFIFRFLSLARKTGKLRVDGPVGSGRIFFRKGEIYHAESDVRREGFGRKLLNAGKLTQEQLRSAVEYCATHGKGLGEGLVDQGLIDRSELERVLREEIEEVALGLFANRSGAFSFAPDEEVESDTLILVPVESLIEEDSEAFKHKVPVLNPASRATQVGRGDSQISVSAEEWRVIASIDGRRTVGEIGRRLGENDFSVLRSLRRLLSLGLVAIAGESESAGIPADVGPAGRGEPGSVRRAVPRPRRAPPPPPPPPPPRATVAVPQPGHARPGRG